MNESDSDSRIDFLRQQRAAVLREDAMSEAGRKVLLAEFIRVLEVEDGSRSGEDIEDVHKMRVAIRRMRSAFRLLEDYYKPKSIGTFQDELRRVMRAAGAVRDLDVMIHDLTAFKDALEDEQAAKMQEVIDALDLRRVEARKHLVRVLDSKAYRRFVKDFSRFLTIPGAGAKPIDRSGIMPYQLRHILTLMIYQHLLAVRAYDTVLEGADEDTLHALRIEFKRLRYIVSLFAEVLGSQSEEFVEEIKRMQDLLGRMNDIRVAHERLNKLMNDLDGDQNSVLWLYINHLDAEKPQMLAKLPEAWKRFNSKTVQRKLAAAVIDL